MGEILLRIRRLIVRALLKSASSSKVVALTEGGAYPVCAIAVRVVPAAKLVSVVGDIRRQGLGVVANERVVAVRRIDIVVAVLGHGPASWW